VESAGHNLGEGPYSVVGTDRRGWGLACSCGWRSTLYGSRELAAAAMGPHLHSPAVRLSWRERRRDRLSGSADDRRRPVHHR
jgi:hypothetical protein